MATRIETLLTKVNTILANKGRWEEANLLDLLDTAQKLIAQRTEVLKRTTFLGLVEGQAEYSLAPEVYKLYRIVYRGQILPIRTREYLDHARGVDWETHKGSCVECIVTNLMDIPALRIYPMLGDDLDLPPFGVVSDWTNSEFNSPFGVVTDIDLNLASGEFLTIYHSYIPPTLETTADEVLLSSRYDAAMVHYVTFMALRQNEDTQSRSMASEELQLFQVELQQIYKDAMQESTADASSFAINYLGGFER